MFRKNPFRTNYSSIFSAEVQNLTVFFIYLHDSNSIFWAAGINSEWVSGGTVGAWSKRATLMHRMREKEANQSEERFRLREGTSSRKLRRGLLGCWRRAGTVRESPSLTARKVENLAPHLPAVLQGCGWRKRECLIDGQRCRTWEI